MYLRPRSTYSLRISITLRILIGFPFLCSALLVVKKLRYYARFIVICLLLNRRSLVLQLVEELQALVEQYVKEFKPPDAPAWRLVLQEVTLFLQVHL